MSRFEIVGDIETFTSKHLELIYDALERLNFKGNEISIKPFGGVGDNYSSDLKLLKVKLNDEKYFNIIAKTSFTSKENMNLPTEMQIISNVIFNNEIIMYTEVLPLMVELQEKAEVPVEDNIKYATCYSPGINLGNEIILLEDLSKKNYVMLDRLATLSNDGVRLVLAKLAVFHSLSHVIKANTPEKYNETTRKLIDMNALEGAQTFLSHFVFLADQFGQFFEEEKYKKIMKGAILEYVHNEVKLLTADKGSRYSVITHGDSWNNNILFKFEEDKIMDCVMVDYQLSRESRPVTDILYFVFNCTDYETRSKHYNEWLDFYHSQFGKSLSHFGLNIDNVYSRDRFDSDLMRYAKSSLGRAVVTLAMLLRKPEEAAEAKEALAETKTIEDMANLMQANSLHVESMKLIKGRIEEVINSCIDFGYWNYN